MANNSSNDTLRSRTESERGIVVKFSDLQTRIQPPEGMIRDHWHQHPKGRGWVERTTTIDPTAYVGPKAIVMGTAHVLGMSRIEGNAFVSGSVIVRDSVVTGAAAVIGRAVITKSFIGGSAQIAGFSVVQSQRRTKGRLDQPKRLLKQRSLA